MAAHETLDTWCAAAINGTSADPRFTVYFLMLVNAVGYLAEAAYHHPDLTVTWGRLTVKLQNHAAGGISDKDFELAKKIEEVVLWRPTGGALEGTPNKWVRPGDPR
jgi:pterin-4a-carbinolamine dehydratase